MNGRSWEIQETLKLCLTTERICGTYIMIRNALEDSVCEVEVNWGWNCALCKFGHCFVYIDTL